MNIRNNRKDWVESGWHSTDGGKELRDKSIIWTSHLTQGFKYKNVMVKNETLGVTQNIV